MDGSTIYRDGKMRKVVLCVSVFYRGRRGRGTPGLSMVSLRHLLGFQVGIAHRLSTLQVEFRAGYECLAIKGI